MFGKREDSVLKLPNDLLQSAAVANGKKPASELTKREKIATEILSGLLAQLDSDYAVRRALALTDELLIKLQD